MHLHDRRIIETRREPRLAAEPLDVRRGGVVEELDGDGSFQTRVAGQIDLPAAALAEPANQLVPLRSFRFVTRKQDVGSEQVLLNHLRNDRSRLGHRPTLIVARR